jgi:hypothetical protein
VPLEGDGDTVPGELELPAGGLAPDTAVERRQEIDRLRGAFYGLSRDHHRILLMRELEGRSYVEIGERMEMTPSMVESTLFRAHTRRSSIERRRLAPTTPGPSRQRAMNAASDGLPLVIGSHMGCSKLALGAWPCQRRARGMGWKRDGSCGWKPVLLVALESRFS